MFSNIGEHVRRLPRRPAGQRSTPGSRKRRGWSPPVEGTLVPGKSDALTCADRKGSTRLAKGLLKRPGPSRRERCQRARADRAAPADKAATLTPPPCFAHEGSVDSPEAGTRVVKRAAVGGWMTARWSSVVLGAAATPGPEDDPRGRATAGYPTVLFGRSPKRMFPRVLVTRNVGCRNGVRGILATCPRKGREAWRGHDVERRRR